MSIPRTPAYFAMSASDDGISTEQMLAALDSRTPVVKTQKATGKMFFPRDVLDLDSTNEHDEFDLPLSLRNLEMKHNLQGFANTLLKFIKDSNRQVRFWLAGQIQATNKECEKKFSKTIKTRLAALETKDAKVTHVQLTQAEVKKEKEKLRNWSKLFSLN